MIHTALHLGHHDLEKDSHGTQPGCGPFHAWVAVANVAAATQPLKGDTKEVNPRPYLLLFL